MSSDEDLIEALRAANPVPPASSTDAAQRAALLKEILAMPTATSSPAKEATHRRRRFAYATSAAAAAVALVIVVAVVNRDGTKSPVAAPPTTPVVDSTPSTGPVLSPGLGLGSCVESYDLASLTHREVAFDGSVTAIEGNQVTFNVNEWFKGGSSTTVTLDGNGMTGAAITSTGGPTLTVGQRFLVAGDGGFAWSCGFTQSYDQATAGQWRTALA